MMCVFALVIGLLDLHVTVLNLQRPMFIFQLWKNHGRKTMMFPCPCCRSMVSIGFLPFLVLFGPAFWGPVCWASKSRWICGFIGSFCRKPSESGSWRCHGRRCSTNGYDDGISYIYIFVYSNVYTYIYQVYIHIYQIYIYIYVLYVFNGIHNGTYIYICG